MSILADVAPEGALELAHLDNGLAVALVPNRQAPLVTSVLWYRAGTRDEPPGQGGIAHFLEHMMFKGSPRFLPGEVDRLTQAMGGANNAFTSHDATAYYFQLAADRWTESLAMEADRMLGLRLDPEEVESERRVILEEIVMYEDDPWDGLSREVEEAIYGAHPYGRPVLGTREELLAMDGTELAAFHGRFYRPGNAVLVLAGDFGDAENALAEVERAFGAIPAGGAEGRPEAPPRRLPAGLARVERRRGEVGRLLLALPIPAATDPDSPALRMAAAILGIGRGSRLYRGLVDEEQLCAWIAAGIGDAPDPGVLTVSAELLPGNAPGPVEEAVLAALERLAAEPVAAAELGRAREVLLADWAFSHERISQQALTAGSDLVLFHAGWSAEQMAALHAVTPEDVRQAAARHLDPGAGAVLGWSLPAAGSAE